MGTEELQGPDTILQRMFKDMYLGDGKYDPPILTRLDRIEQILTQLKSWKWIIVAATVSMIADIIADHIK
jgi:hypothetical protein